MGKGRRKATPHRQRPGPRRQQPMIPPRLPVRKKETEDGTGRDGWISYGLAGMQGWRDDMEDAHLALPDFDKERNYGLFGVFDGHGGAAVARLAAERLPGILRKLPAYAAGDFETAFQQTYLQLDQWLASPAGRREVKKGGMGEGPDGMGTTAVVALIRGREGEVVVANAGDSRCVLSRLDGAAQDLSTDHVPRLPGELNRIRKAGGNVNNEGRINGNLNLSRALGDLFYKRNQRLQPGEQLISGVPEVRRHRLQQDDLYLLLGCDGIWERTSSEGVAGFLQTQLTAKSPPPLSRACARFLDANLSPDPDDTEGLGCDNMSLVLVRLPKIINGPEVAVKPTAPAERSEALRSVSQVATKPRGAKRKAMKVKQKVANAVSLGVCMGPEAPSVNKVASPGPMKGKRKARKAAKLQAKGDTAAVLTAALLSKEDDAGGLRKSSRIHKKILKRKAEASSPEVHADKRRRGKPMKKAG